MRHIGPIDINYTIIHPNHFNWKSPALQWHNNDHTWCPSRFHSRPYMTSCYICHSTQCILLLFYLYRFPSQNNNAGHKIAVICAQCFSHVFVQQAESVPAKNPVFKFIPLTNSYMPYLLHTDDMPRMDWIKWDSRKFLEKLLVAPKLTCTSPGSPASPTITIMR